ncbi:MAG: bacteriohopanetetrol glucosamine biosynthesis glycosyltransferase HpnI [Bryobacteraceae bacterium]|nr:bacteriohopanetetrol glucosamine biosynthesis glycosyltransferase HpnI [Bryobacteraceae bacterium]MDW8380427.1 bacteriohopanetetrol glucosamine biosynthesis glycosyltransferase HpnI [Bryobacterales bacterium]
MMATAVTVVLLALVAGATVYTLLSLEAARRFLDAKATSALNEWPPISILKPLAGLEDELEANLRSFFEQEYPRFEVLMAVSTEEDPALPLAHRVASAYPHVPHKIMVTGEPPYPNRKVCSLDRMVKASAYDLLVMSDSDIRVCPNMLRRIAAEFADSKLALATCPYRAVPGSSLWSQLEAILMNTEFWSGVLTAWLLEGMRFAVGPTIVARKQVIEALGGFETLRHYLAEDFVLGQRAAERGFGVSLSRYVVEHHIGNSGFRANAHHRLRWVRSTRRSRPAGYIGQLFTYPVPLALLLLWWSASWWPLCLVAFVLRMVAAWTVAVGILRDPLVRRKWWLVPLQDCFSFAFWLAGFAGNTIQWRGKVFYLEPDGKFREIR